MKNFKMYMSSLAIIALLFTSCSKEESGIIENDSEKATLSFGAIINDIASNRAATKQAIGDMPACSDDDPAYVRIVLMRGDTEVVGTAANPYRVNLAPGQIFTVEDAELELEQGNYTLTHFSVYNAAGELIWLAPRGGDLANFVDTPLPLAIDLRAGVKKYVDVPVLCFDNREVIQYGYQFFEIDTNRAVDFCFFANYCDASGRHFAARYRVDVWQGTNENGTVLYSNLTSQTGVNNDGDFFASPVCVPLPANDDDRNEDYIYYRLTLLDWDENYGDAPASVITGTLSLADIEANFGDGDDVEYEHFRFGCGDDGGNGGETPSDRDNDGVPDATDNCPDTAGPASNSGCPEETTPCDQTDPNADCDNDGILNKCDEDNPNWDNFDCDEDTIINSEDDCPYEAGVSGTEGVNGCPAITLCLPQPATDCETLEESVTVNSSLQISELTQGDLTVEITAEGLFVGITPVAPYEIWNIEVVYNGVAVCAASEDPDLGASLTIAGVTEADLPLNLVVRANYCVQ